MLHDIFVHDMLHMWEWRYKITELNDSVSILVCAIALWYSHGGEIPKDASEHISIIKEHMTVFVYKRMTTP